MIEVTVQKVVVYLISQFWRNVVQQSMGPRMKFPRSTLLTAEQSYYTNVRYASH